MNIVNTQIAYILHKRSYRESSSILEVFTKDYGRVSLMARGSRGSRSKLAGHLLLFTPLMVSWQGKGDMPYLKSAERADLKAPVLKGKSLYSAMYINELMMYLLHKNDVHETLFETYHHCLYALEKAVEIEISLREFELRLLETLGFGLNLSTEADTGNPLSPEKQYYYHVEHGAVLGGDAVLCDVPRMSGECLLALAHGRYHEIAANPLFLNDLKHLMRYVINFHLGHKKLKSREMFRPLGQITTALCKK